jgi:uncharacterized membrane protein
MTTTRLEAFSDGVLAIVITIMVLELKVPHGTDWATLAQVWPGFISYVLSFIYVGIHWNNHHHLLAACRRVDASIMWANLHLLFWLSLVPFVTSWMGNTTFANWPVALYGVVLLASALAYTFLVNALKAIHGQETALAAALANNTKGNISLVLYLLAIPLAFVNSWLAGILYAIVAALWLVPDTRIERVMPH